MDTLRHDLRLALRLLWKDRGFAVTALLTLAICIGANTAIFTVVRSVLLRPLPYPDADRLVFSYDRFPGAGVERAGTSVPNYRDRLELVSAFESQALYQWTGYTVGQGESAEGVTALNVTPSFFDVLETSAHRGRTFTPEEAVAGRARVAILSFAYWQRAHAGSDAAIGRDIRLNGQNYAIVGVMPERFAFANADIALWTPVVFTDEERTEDARWSQNHEQIARLAPGATRRPGTAADRCAHAAEHRARGPDPGRSSSTPVTARASCRSKPISSATCAGRCTCSGAACCSCCSSPPPTSPISSSCAPADV